MVTSPTPLTRESWSCTEETRKSDRSVPSWLPSSETKPRHHEEVAGRLATVTPLILDGLRQRG